MKLLYGTGNPAKLDAMRHRLAGLGIELIGLKDLGGVKQPEIIEDGKRRWKMPGKGGGVFQRASYAGVLL